MTRIWTRGRAAARAIEHEPGAVPARILLLHEWMTNTANSAPHLSTADLARLRRKLEHRRAALLATQRGATESARGVSDYAIEDGDIAERMIEQDSALRQGAVDNALLADIERALQKLEAGTYGFSEDSGTPIEIDRLDALPWARCTLEEDQRHAARHASTRDSQGTVQHAPCRPLPMTRRWSRRPVLDQR